MRDRTRAEAHQEELMKFVTTFALGVLLLSCGSGGSHSIREADLCNQAFRAMCAKVFSCEDVISVLARAALGGTQATCEAMIGQASCPARWCQPDQTYHGDNAYECKQQFDTAECGTLDAMALATNIASILAAVPPCSQICTTNDAGSTPGG
jgi:hypothetical protein